MDEVDRVGRDVPDARFETLCFGVDPWRLVAAGDVASAAHVPAVFTLGNGFIGRRGPGDAPNAPRVYLNGVFEKVPIAYHEGAFGYPGFSDTRLSVADATMVVVAIDGVQLGAPDRVELDLQRGLSVEVTVRDDVEVRVERLVSMARPAIVATRIGVRAADRSRLAVTPEVTPPTGQPPGASDSLYDPRLGPQLHASPWTEERRVDEADCTGRVDRLAGSGFAVAALASRLRPSTDRDGWAMFDSFAAYAAARDGDPLAGACAALAAAEAAGFDALAAEQDAWFAAHWASCHVTLPDAPAAEQALRHGLFQLVQAVGRDGATSIAAKGQTGEGYEGHVFWDADLYVLPVFVHTRPEIARAMLAWRIGRLDAARGNARAMGQQRGALYPWRTIDGGECSSFFPAGSAQYHINADIAYALKLYVDTTGDASILAEGGAETLVETARIWLEIGFHDPARGGAFVINSVTGPDEYTALVDNNLYTNMMAAEHLRFAAAAGAAAGWLDAAEAGQMTDAADAMLLPFDMARGVYGQDDGFFDKAAWPFATTPADRYPLLLHHHPLMIFRHRVAKQADAVLATVLLRDAFKPAMRAAMLDCYEAVTVHDSTLSASAFATAAANVGDVERAWRYWRVSVLTDLSNLFGNSDHGLHMAALAGGWTALARGFAGMRTTDGRLGFAPIAVPPLGRYAFRTRFRGCVVDVEVGLAEVVYRLVEGAALAFAHHDEALALAAGETVSRPL